MPYISISGNFSLTEVVDLSCISSGISTEAVTVNLGVGLEAEETIVLHD